MALCLTITSYHKITPGQASEFTVGEGAITIGRNAENDWVLPDPERLVSSRHCTIQYRDGRYYLTDDSTNGSELVNAGVKLRRGNSEPLQHGEVIRIGDYEIQARIDSAPAGALPGQAEPASFEALMANQVSAAATPTAAFAAGARSHQTLPDLFDFLGPSSVPAPSQPDHVPAQQHDFRPPTPIPAPAPAPAPIAEPPAPVAAAPGPLGLIPADWDALASAAAPVIPATALDVAPAPEPDIAPPDVATPLASAVAAPEPWTAPTPQPPSFSEAPPEPAPVDVSSPQPEPAPVTVSHPHPHPQPASAPAAPATAHPDDLLTAFLRGAGIEHLRIDAAQAQAQMEALGRSYRLMVEGLIDVLRARSSLKGEFRLQQTSIAPVQNNPLKFAPNADEALLLLLRHGNAAFMAPDQAVRDSFDDLRAHQLAVMAGMQAAIEHLLARFEPGQLEARLAPASGLAKVFGGSRQAHCWQQFTELYGQMSREAEDDFHDLFGREFSRAYEAHATRPARD